MFDVCFAVFEGDGVFPCAFAAVADGLAGGFAFGFFAGEGARVAIVGEVGGEVAGAVVGFEEDGFVGGDCAACGAWAGGEVGDGDGGIEGVHGF
jgi:hypothetical protein